MRKNEIERIKRQLLEHAYAGSYGGSIDLGKVNGIIDGSVIEITKLQDKHDSLKKEVERLTTELKKHIDENDGFWG